MRWKPGQALNQKLKLLEGSQALQQGQGVTVYQRKQYCGMRVRELVLLGSPIKCNTAVHLFKDAGPGVTAQRASRGQPVPSP